MRRLRSPLVVYLPFLVGSTALAFVLHSIDRRGLVADLGHFIGAPEPSEVATNLSAAAALVLTMTIAAFSTLVVALVLISNQFAPRVLIGFMRDLRLNFYLAGFMGAFIYCVWMLILPSSVNTIQHHTFVPALSYWAALLTCAACAGFFFAFMFYLVRNINVSRLIERIAAQTRAEIAYLCPDRWAPDEYDTPLPEEVRAPHRDALDPSLVLEEVRARRSGYIQRIDVEHLRRACLDAQAPQDLTLYEEYFVGQFILEGTPIARYTGQSAISSALEARILKAFNIRGYRTIAQDIAFGLRELVDVSIKAISPAVNDPTTAENCIDYIGVILAELAVRKPPQHRIHVGPQEHAQVFMRRLDFSRLMRFSFDQILHYGHDDPKVIERVLWTLGQVTRVCPKVAYLRIFLSYYESIEQSLTDIIDKPSFSRVRWALERVRSELAQRLGPRHGQAARDA